MSWACLSLGSNLGDSRSYLQQAISAITKESSCQLLAKSSLYRTAAWGKTDQPDFLNAAVLLETSLEPLALLAFCQQLEKEAERLRLEHWGPRTLDVDIIAIEGCTRNEQPLLLPHPYYRERLFVLRPLLEILGDSPLAPGEPGLAALEEACILRDPEQNRLIEVLAGPEEW